MTGLSVGQFFHGALISLASWILAGLKARTIPVQVPVGGETFFDRIPQEARFEFVILVLGLGVFICSLFQKRAHVKYTGWQLIASAAIVSISAFMGIRAAAMGLGEISGLSYLVYLLLGLGVIISILSLLQLINKVPAGTQNR